MHHETASKNERPVIGTVVRATIELRQHQRQRRNVWHRVVSPKNMNTEAMSRFASRIPWMRMIVIYIIVGCTIVDGFISDTVLQYHPPRLSWWLPAVSRSDPMNDDATIGISTYHDCQYTLMTWNILAPVYATPDKYSSYCSKSDLDWKTSRCPRILQTIDSTNADIVCLQEVQIDTWYTDLLPHFQNNSNNTYTCILQNVTRNHPVACATLIKSSNFHIHFVESRSRALLLILQETTKPTSAAAAVATPSAFLYLANVHLDARHDQDMTRYNQIKSLLHRIEYHYESRHHVNEEGNRRRPSPPLSLSSPNIITTKASLNHNHLVSESAVSPPTIIIAGDFNMIRTNPIYALLSTGEYEKLQANQKSTTTKVRESNQLARTLPYLPLVDVHNRAGQSIPVLLRTFAGGSILDYIWTSAECVHAVPWMIDPMSCATTTTILRTDRHQAQRPPRFRWPSKDQPSDHVPIGIQFLIT